MKIHPAVFIFSLIATLLVGYLIATEVHKRRSAKQAWKEFVEIAKEEFPQYMSGEKASPQEQAKDFLDAVDEGVKEFGAVEVESVHKAYKPYGKELDEKLADSDREDWGEEDKRLFKDIEEILRQNND